MEAYTHDIVASSEIEGLLLNPDQVRSSIARRMGVQITGEVPYGHYVEGIVQMMMDAVQSYDNPLTDDRLFGWHCALFPNGRNGYEEINVGKYRVAEMNVISGALGREKVHYHAPAPERVPEEMNIFLKTEDEIAKMRRANQLVGATLAELAKHIKPGVTTLQLDTIAEEFIRDHGAIPTFKNFPNPIGGSFPASICTSINAIVVHGIPSDKVVLKDGDIISIDCGTLLDGYNGDSCYTFCVGDVAPEVKPEVKELLRVTKESLYKGIEQAIAGHRLGDIGYAVQHHCEEHGYGVVREFVGHGIGHEMHEDPQVPNYGKQGTGKQLKNGLCIAIEPMITMGSHELAMLEDRWGVITRDGKPAAHFEHTIAIHHGKADIMSSFAEIEEVERQKH